jgi:hypothetical protein
MNISPFSSTLLNNNHKYYLKNFLVFALFTTAIILNMCLIPSMLSNKSENIQAVMNLLGIESQNLEKVFLIFKTNLIIL